jgi:hypothetical protein
MSAFGTPVDSLLANAAPLKHTALALLLAFLFPFWETLVSDLLNFGNFRIIVCHYGT